MKPPKVMEPCSVCGSAELRVLRSVHMANSGLYSSHGWRVQCRCGSYLFVPLVGPGAKARAVVAWNAASLSDRKKLGQKFPKTK